MFFISRCVGSALKLQQLIELHKQQLEYREIRVKIIKEWLESWNYESDKWYYANKFLNRHSLTLRWWENWSKF